jgi:Pentapeptide repeats (8 copies)
MANAEHLKILQQGVDAWNAWTAKEPSIVPDLSEADLRGADLRRVNLIRAILIRANLSGAILGTNTVTDLRGTHLETEHLTGVKFERVQILLRAIVATLRRANLSAANLSWADLSGAVLRKAILNGATLLETNLVDAVLTDCRIYGISAWNVKLSEGTKQQDLVITAHGEPEVTVDNIEVAQFVYLLLHNEKIRDVIDTVGKKGVLLLGRFTEGRIAVLERLREELRKRGYLPIVFNFDKPETKDFTETVRLLAGLSKFVIADVTSPKSAPYELGAIVSQTMIPFQPIIAAGETPFAMMQDLWINYPDRVFQPIAYQSVDRLIENLESEIIGPAETRFNELVLRKAERMTTRRV